MAIVFLKDSTLTAIANAIRGKLGTTETMLPSEMAGMIETITGGGGESLPVKSGMIDLDCMEWGIDENGLFYMGGLNAQRAIYAKDAEIYVNTAASALGNTVATNVLSGSTFSSASGLKQDGKLYVSSIKTLNNVKIPANWVVESDGYNRGYFKNSLGDATAADVTAGKIFTTDDGTFTGTKEETSADPTYTLQIMTTNPGDGSDSIVYYAPGSSEKTNLTLTSDYQSITCGDFIALYRGSANNATTLIYFRNDADSNVKSIGGSDKYGVGLNPHGGWSVINIGAIMRDYPTVTKIRIGYSAG